MKRIRQYLGIVWMLLAVLSLYYLVDIAINEIAKYPYDINKKIQWGIFVGVFIPISIALMIFGYYALTKEYDKLEFDNDKNPS